MLNYCYCSINVAAVNVDRDFVVSVRFAAVQSIVAAIVLIKWLNGSCYCSYQCCYCA